MLDEVQPDSLRRLLGFLIDTVLERPATQAQSLVTLGLPISSHDAGVQERPAGISRGLWFMQQTRRHHEPVAGYPTSAIDLSTLWSLFNPAETLGGLADFRSVRSDEIRAYRSLLDHHSHMTVAVESHFVLK